MDVGDGPQGDVVDRQLVVAGPQGPAVLEPADHPLTGASTPHRSRSVRPALSGRGGRAPRTLARVPSPRQRLKRPRAATGRVTQPIPLDFPPPTRPARVRRSD